MENMDLSYNHFLILSLGLLDEVENGWDKHKQLRCLYAVSNNTTRHYTHITIPKQNGGFRELFIPDFLLKKIQQNILHNILEKFPVSGYATAYSKGSGVLKNAEPHVGQKQILKLDICNFFDSIPFYRVYGIVFSRVYFPPAVAALLTNLCCYNDCLPQGAPTSAAISNLIMKPFDNYMGKWCEERKIVYTRYCDDMTFSGDFDAVAVIRKVKNFLKVMGFELNNKKIKVINSSNRQSVTGIVVNEKAQVSREYRNKLRQEIYYCEKYGISSHLLKLGNPRYLPADREQIQCYLQSLLGRVNYVLQFNPQDKFFKEAKIKLKTMLKTGNTKK